MNEARGNRNAESAVTDGHIPGGTEPGRKRSVNAAIEELEKSAEDWVNRLPETLQDEP